MLKNIQTTLVSTATKRFHNASNVKASHARSASLFSKVGLVAAAVMTASAPVNAASFLDGLVDVNFLAMQNYQSIQAKEGAFRPVDEEQQGDGVSASCLKRS